MPKRILEETENDNIQIGYINAYINSIVSELPTNLVDAVNSISEIGIEAETMNIVTTYLIEKKQVNDKDVYSMTKHLSPADLAKLKKRKKYRIDTMRKNFYANYDAVKAGEKIKDAVSPLSYVYLQMLAGSRNTSISDSIENIKKDFELWYEHITDRKTTGNMVGLETYFGFTDYKFFYLYEQNQENEAYKMAILDLEECVFRLSRLERYRDFYNFIPLRKSGLFELRKTAGRPVTKKEPTDCIVYFVDGPYLSSLTLDETEFKIINYLTTKAVASGITNSKVSTEGSLVEICKLCYPKRTIRKNTNEKVTFSSREYESVRNRLERMKNIRFEQIQFTDDKNYVKTGRSISLFDELYIPTEIRSYSADSETEETSLRKTGKGNEYVYRAVMGPSITKAIISMHMQPVLNGPMLQLEDSASKLIYMNICQDRIDDLTRYHTNIHSYSLIDMHLMVRMSDKKAKRIKIYLDALKNLQDTNTLIESVEWIQDREIYFVKWIPLNEIEKRDIQVIGENSSKKLFLGGPEDE